MTHLIRYTVLFSVLFTSSFISRAQNCGPVDRPALRKMLTELGYEVKDLETTPGKEKYEVSHTKQGFNVPVAYEISPSTNYIWLTVYLGKPPADTSIRNSQLLRQNFTIQPCQFYITEKGNMMMGLAIENRGVTNAVLKRLSDMVTDKVVQTTSYWNQ